MRKKRHLLDMEEGEEGRSVLGPQLDKNRIFIFHLQSNIVICYA